MDMRGQDQRHFAVTIKHQERYQFLSQAHEDGRLHGDPYLSDEPDPVGDAAGPATPALLGSALGHCLSAALLEALRHAHLPVLDCETEAVAVVEPNEEGNPRINRVDVVIRPKLGEDSPRKDRCASIFENYCTVTQSVTRGIQVNVDVQFEIDETAGAAQVEAAQV
jgi:organic hydroperoxide reductase OsmC/OhrA